MRTQEQERDTRRDLPPRCRHHECVCARAEELAAMGMTNLAVEIHVSDMPVRCRAERGQPGLTERSDEGCRKRSGQ